MSRRIALSTLALAALLLGMLGSTAAIDVVAFMAAPAEEAAPAKPAEKKAAKARIVVAAPAVQLNVVQANDAMVQQWTQQFRTALLGELNFVRRVCDLTPEQRPKVRAAGEAALLDAAKQFARYQQGQRVVNGELQFQPWPPAIIRSGMLKSLEQTLTPEQFARYQSEYDARIVQRKQASILSVVARLDTALSLTNEQREKIDETLKAKWRDEWEQWLMVSRYGDQYFPQVPQDMVIPHLDSEQRLVWNGLQKINVSFHGSFVQVQDDDAWWGNGPDPVDPPEAREQPVEIAPAVIKTLTKWLRLD